MIHYENLDQAKLSSNSGQKVKNNLGKINEKYRKYKEKRSIGQKTREYRKMAKKLSTKD